MFPGLPHRNTLVYYACIVTMIGTLNNYAYLSYFCDVHFVTDHAQEVKTTLQ